MASDVNGVIVVPVYSDDGIVKPIVNDDGRIPVTIGESTNTQDVDIVACSVTLPAQLKGSDVNIPVDIKACSVTLPVSVDASVSTIGAYQYGWDNTTWHKQPMLRGYMSAYREYVIATASAASTIYAQGGLVSSGWIRVIEGFVAWHSDTVVRNIQYGVYYGGTHVGAGAYQSCPTAVYYGGPIDLTIQYNEGFYVSCYVDHSGENIQGWICGRNIKVNA